MYLSNTDDWLHHWMILIDIESITDWHWICSLWAVMVYAAPRRGRSTMGLVPRAMEPDCLGMGLIWINRDAKRWAWHWLPFQSVHLQALPTPGCRKDGFSGCVHLIFSQATRRKKLTGGFEIVTILAANEAGAMGAPEPSAFAYFATASNQLLSNLRSGARSIFSYSRIFSCPRGKQPDEKLFLGLIEMLQIEFPSRVSPGNLRPAPITTRYSLWLLSTQRWM